MMKKPTRLVTDSVTDIRVTLTCLLVVFVVLKLNGEIDWSWWWVLSPFLIPAAISLIYIGVLYATLYGLRRAKRRTR
jgi:hypothetical protein